MDKSFWDSRWENAETGWDVGGVSAPLKAYIDQLENKALRILVPGCGNAHEAEYLWEKGFKNTWIVEISQLAIDSFRKRYPSFPVGQIIHGDFFDVSSAFDLVLEQTFFCAIHPSRRVAYARKMSEILKPSAKLVGLLFDFPLESGPPFGGSEAEYRGYFEPFFTIIRMERAHNSIKPRLGRELFIQLEKKRIL